MDITTNPSIDGVELLVTGTNGDIHCGELDYKNENPSFFHYSFVMYKKNVSVVV